MFGKHGRKECKGQFLGFYYPIYLFFYYRNHTNQPPSSPTILNHHPQPSSSTITLNHHPQPPSSTTILNHHSQPPPCIHSLSIFSSLCIDMVHLSCIDQRLGLAVDYTTENPSRPLLWLSQKTQGTVFVTNISFNMWRAFNNISKKPHYT